MQNLLLGILVTAAFLAVPSLANNHLRSYYASVMGLTGPQLHEGLKKLITETHTDREYENLLAVYFTSDLDRTYDGDGTILDMYSEVPGQERYNYRNIRQRCGRYRVEGDCFNREHLMPQGLYKRRAPMRNDFFHVFPADGYVNHRRGRLPFGEVGATLWVSSNGSKIGMNTFDAYRGEVFEPIDEFKGDIARAMLYFGVRYAGLGAQWQPHPMINRNRNFRQFFTPWFLKLLIKWHYQDPVSRHEKVRNEAGFRYQGNRNPFIDNPNWVRLIWFPKGQLLVQ